MHENMTVEYMTRSSEALEDIGLLAEIIEDLCTDVTHVRRVREKCGLLAVYIRAIATTEGIGNPERAYAAWQREAEVTA